jgi:hypothetical protein
MVNEAGTEFNCLQIPCFPLMAGYDCQEARSSDKERQAG